MAENLLIPSSFWMAFSWLKVEISSCKTVGVSYVSHNWQYPTLLQALPYPSSLVPWWPRRYEHTSLPPQPLQTLRVANKTYYISDSSQPLGQSCQAFLTLDIVLPSNQTSAFLQILSNQWTINMPLSSTLVSDNNHLLWCSIFADTDFPQNLFLLSVLPFLLADHGHDHAHHDHGLPDHRTPPSLLDTKISFLAGGSPLTRERVARFEQSFNTVCGFFEIFIL